MDYLDLSSSSDDEDYEVDSALLAPAQIGLEKEAHIYGTAVETLLTLNDTNHVERKAQIVERSVLTAIRAYKQSNLITQPKNVSPETLNKILELVVSECYRRDESFSLHLNLVFAVIILGKSCSSSTAGIQSMAKYLSGVTKAIK